MDEGARDGEDEGEDLRQVGAGLRLVLLGLAVAVVVEVGFPVATALVVKPAKDGDVAATFQALRRSAVIRMLGTDQPAVATALNGLVVLASVLGITGKVFCARGAGATGAAGFAAASLVCDGLGLALYAAGQAGPAGEATGELGDLAPLAGMLAYFLFLRALARLADRVRSPGLIDRARRQQLGSILLLAGAFLAAGFAPAGGLLAVLLAGAVVSGGMIVLFVLYLRLLRDLRRAVEATADETAPGPA